MVLNFFFDISTSFRFSEISVECPVHSWSLSLSKDCGSEFVLLSIKVFIYIYVCRSLARRHFFVAQTDLIVVIFLYSQKDYSGDFQLQCYGMDTDNSWTSGGEVGYCFSYPALYEGARQAIRFCPYHYQTISNIQFTQG